MNGSHLPAAIHHRQLMVRGNDLGDLDELLAGDVAFQSPAVFTAKRGRAEGGRHLRAAQRCLLLEPSFRYARKWIGADSAVLEFTLTLGGAEIQGVGEPRGAIQ